MQHDNQRSSNCTIPNRDRGVSMIAQFEANTFIKSARLNELVDGVNKASLYPEVIQANETIYVGTGQTYTTLNSAIDYCKKFTSKNYTIEIIIKAGTALAEQINIVKCDLSHVKISSEDAIVNVNSTSFIALDSEDGSYKQFIMGTYSKLPLINTTFKNVGINSTIGIKLNYSSIYFTSGKGCTFFGYGLKAMRNSYAKGDNCIFDDSIYYGVSISYYSTVELHGVSCKRVGLYGLYASICSNAIVININATNTNQGIVADDNSEINMAGGVVSSSSVAVQCSASRINALSSNLNGNYGIQVIFGGIVNANEGTVNSYSQAINTLTASGIIFK